MIFKLLFQARHPSGVTALESQDKCHGIPANRVMDNGGIAAGAEQGGIACRLAQSVVEAIYGEISDQANNYKNNGGNSRKCGKCAFNGHVIF